MRFNIGDWVMYSQSVGDKPRLARVVRLTSDGYCRTIQFQTGRSGWSKEEGIPFFEDCANSFWDTCNNLVIPYKTPCNNIITYDL